MKSHLKRDKIILYAAITVIFVVHWTYNDLAVHPESLGISVLDNIWNVIFIVAVNFFYFEYALPFVTAQKNWRLVRIVCSVIAHLTVLMAGLYIWRELGEIIYIYDPLFDHPTTARKLSAVSRFTVGSFLGFAVVKLFFDYTQLRYEGQQVRLEKKQAELVFLRSQINPHFLFNTLNNIYSLSQYQPQLVSESVLRLSKILRYVLYESGNDFITVDKEIKIINDYIDLERLRYSDKVSIDFNYEVSDTSEMLPPLLLLPLIENAFKHGISESRGKRFVHIRLELQKKQLLFLVRNSTDPSLDNQEIKDNIGLSNLRRRLSLLYQEFNLLITQKEATFTAHLKINLLSHV